MPSKARRETIDEDVVGVYHCYNRTVRQLPVLERSSPRDDTADAEGDDSEDRSQRRDWVLAYLKQYAGYFAIDILDYALMKNHFHLMLRNRPEIVSGLTDHEVVERWLHISPESRDAAGEPKPPTEAAIQALMPEVAELRKRLSSISWLMRLFAQRVAIRSNQEDDCQGHFFAGRYKSKRLKTETDVLNCSMYIDLNMIRAGQAETPESSRYTSAFDRIKARWSDSLGAFEQEDRKPVAGSSDAWLAPVEVDDRAEAYTGPTELIGQADLTPSRSGVLETESSATESPATVPPPNVNAYNPIGAPRVSNKGFLSMSLPTYLELLDFTGRIVRLGKASIPESLPPILERLQMTVDDILNAFLEFDGIDPRLASAPTPET